MFYPHFQTYNNVKIPSHSLNLHAHFRNHDDSFL